MYYNWIIETEEPALELMWHVHGYRKSPTLAAMMHSVNDRAGIIGRGVFRLIIDAEDDDTAETEMTRIVLNKGLLLRRRHVVLIEEVKDEISQDRTV